MTCNHNTNTYFEDFTCMKDSVLVIQGKLSAGGVPMNLSGASLELEISPSASFEDFTAYTPITLNPVGGDSYLFEVPLAVVGSYAYRVKFTDSLGNTWINPIRAGKITVTE